VLQIGISPDGKVVTINGVIDENADFGALQRLAGRVRIDLRGVRRLNSFGCRLWVDAVRVLAARAKVSFVACSSAIIDQLNTTYGFLGSATVESFIGPMRCDACDAEFDHVFEARACIADEGLPAVACTSCGKRAELDDVEDRYLMFLREPTQIR